MITLRFENVTEADIPELLTRPDLQNQTIYDHIVIQRPITDEWGAIVGFLPCVDFIVEPNPDGQVILPTLRERLQAAETLINLILDEEGE